MLIQFTVENFLSFKDPAVFSMIAGKRRSKNKALDNGATFSIDDDLKLLKCAVLYGANASGKSNLFAGLKFMKHFVLYSSKESQAEEKIDAQPYRLAAGYDSAPSSFDIIFSVDGAIYQYSFSADQLEVKTECLVERRNKKDVMLFNRVGRVIELSDSFAEGKGLSEKTRSNALFLSVCANFDGEVSKKILRWFRTLSIVSGIEDIGLMEYTRECLAGEKGSKISSLLKGFDLGMERIGLGDSIEIPKPSSPGEMPRELRIILNNLQKLTKSNGGPPRRAIEGYHKYFDIDGEQSGEVVFSLDRDESEGSKKLVALSGPLVDTFENSKVLLIDEFDARLHPIISKTIIGLFNSAEVNSKNAQLIVATHDTNLLDKDLLRRDQIWFSEKDHFGSSHLSSLTEYRVRNDASFEKDYVMGKYGAIPLLGDLTKVFDEDVFIPDLFDARNEAVHGED
jgi:hypothetical protein